MNQPEGAIKFEQLEAEVAQINEAAKRMETFLSVFSAHVNRLQSAAGQIDKGLRELALANPHLLPKPGFILLAPKVDRLEAPSLDDLLLRTNRNKKSNI